jgi:deazaflavin-dependent oxidoreductase (nitroreductase family)
MDDVIRQALALDLSSTAADRTIDITTIGARSGKPRRIEIWFHRIGAKNYLSGLPGKRAWSANLKANPQFTFHLKNGPVVDLHATAIQITDEAERRELFAALVEQMRDPNSPAGVANVPGVDEWLERSPLVEIRFDD